MRLVVAHLFVANLATDRPLTTVSATDRIGQAKAIAEAQP